MTLFDDPTSREYARMAGVAYLTIAVAGGFSIAYVPGVLQVAGDPAASVANMVANRGLFLAGIAGDVVMMLAELFATVMLFFMFRAVNPTLSAIAALARFSMVGVMAAMLFFHIGALALAAPDWAFAALSPAQRLDMAGVFLRMHDGGVWIWQIFFALHLGLLGALVVRSGLYPRLLGYGMAVGGLGYLLDSVYAFAFPDAALLGQARVVLLAIVTLSEVGFALWLLLRGPRSLGTPVGALPA